MARLGCLLSIIGMVCLFGIVVLPVLPFLEKTTLIDDYLQPLLCEPGETIQRSQYSTRDSEGTSYSMDVSCRNSDRQERDVTGRWMLIGIAGFLVPFLIGLFMFIGGVNRGVRRVVTTANGDVILPTPTTTIFGNKELVNSAMNAMRSAGSKSLTEKLQQVQDARDKGLISSEEYDRLRQEILDKEV